MNMTSPLSLFILTVIILRRLSPAGATTCHPDDESGLLAFKSGITRDPSGLLKTWEKGTDCCNWVGITCRSGDRVTTVSISGYFDAVAAAGFSGTFSPELAKLQGLEGLYISYLRNLTGKFPGFIFQLPKLVFLYIEHIGLYGRIPANIGELAQLFAFSIEGNRFTGTIPSSISNMTQLSQLQLGGNLLTGTLPLELANLKSLTRLSVDGNRLYGNIPDFFNSLTGLYILNLTMNGFSGKIPASIESLAPKLRSLELAHNRLSGKIPEYLGRFKWLDTLDLSWNRFTGAVPQSFSNLTMLANLDLSHNFLIDPFPVMQVEGFQYLDLSYNLFRLKSIPEWVTSMSTFIYSLKLVKCGITMRFEDWNTTDTSFFDHVDLSENEISGSPVSFLNQQAYLKDFRASRNKLRFDLGKITISKEMETLDLSRNLVFGNVPETVVGLQTLDVSYNHLCGELPAAASKFPASSFAGNDCLCGSPLPPCKA